VYYFNRLILTSNKNQVLVFVSMGVGLVFIGIKCVQRIGDRTIMEFDAPLVGCPCDEVCPDRGGEEGENDCQNGFEADGRKSKVNKGGDENQNQAHRRGLAGCVHPAKKVGHSIQAETTDNEKKESGDQEAHGE